jgi:hypothetical protein
MSEESKQQGSPPSVGLKNDVFRLRSVNNIVIAPARSSSDRSSSRAVVAIDHTNSGIHWGFIPFGFILIVVIKFTAPRIEDTPAKCREKMARSTDASACAIPLARGG